MTSHAAELRDRFALAQDMAREAGTVALAYFKDRERLVVETKADPQDVVSIADREVEDLIRARISAAFAADAILGEEYGVSAGSSAYTW
ncbi:MAG: inositol monophosphatase family protein, partial [Alphaproteobacteria bacterium]